MISQPGLDKQYMRLTLEYLGYDVLTLRLQRIIGVGMYHRRGYVNYLKIGKAGLDSDEDDEGGDEQGLEDL